MKACVSRVGEYTFDHSGWGSVINPFFAMKIAPQAHCFPTWREIYRNLYGSPLLSLYGWLKELWEGSFGSNPPPKHPSLQIKC